MNKLEILQSDYESIANEIQSDTSPVGIDAKKTHVIILDKLLKMEARLERIEKELLRIGQKS